MQWLMLQQNFLRIMLLLPVAKSVREFIQLAAKSLGWNNNSNSEAIYWEGEGLNEVGKRNDNGKIVVDWPNIL